MTITAISSQSSSADRVNVFVDGNYRFSLDIFQVGDLGIKVGNEYSEDELLHLESESSFGKLYAHALEYTMIRPHSGREIRDYLWRKTQAKRYKARDGSVKERAGVDQDIADRVYDRLVEKGYINDDSFARYWIENRNLTKGTSRRKLENELRSKGVATDIINEQMATVNRDEYDDLRKVHARKRRLYPDDQKFIAYLMRQGFGYDAVKRVLSEEE